MESDRRRRGEPDSYYGVAGLRAAHARGPVEEVREARRERALIEATARFVAIQSGLGTGKADLVLDEAGGLPSRRSRSTRKVAGSSRKLDTTRRAGSVVDEARARRREELLTEIVERLPRFDTYRGLAEDVDASTSLVVSRCRDAGLPAPGDVEDAHDLADRFGDALAKTRRSERFSGPLGPIGHDGVGGDRR